MFEYVDGDIVKASILLVVIALILGGFLKRHRVFVGIAAVIAIGVLSVVSYQSLSLVEENKKLFQEGRELLCNDDESTLLVSKEEKWTCRDDYFIKDSRMMRANNCELYKSIAK